MCCLLYVDTPVRWKKKKTTYDYSLWLYQLIGAVFSFPHVQQQWQWQSASQSPWRKCIDLSPSCHFLNTKKWQQVSCLGMMICCWHRFSVLNGLTAGIISIEEHQCPSPMITIAPRNTNDICLTIKLNANLSESYLHLSRTNGGVCKQFDTLSPECTEKAKSSFGSQ